MARKSELIDAGTLEKAHSLLSKMGNNAKGIIKLKAIVAAKEHGIKQVATIFNVSRNTIASWVKKLKINPYSLFEIGSGRGRKSRLTRQQIDTVREWLENEPNLTIKHVISRIKAKFDVELHKSAVHQMIKNLSFSYITPRPRHYKQDPTKHEEFKKKSNC